MRKMKKLASMMLALVMVCAMSVTAFAADSTQYTITINNSTDGYVYTAYQIFAGDLSEDGKTLSNVTWGSGIDSTDEDLQSALTTAYGTTDAAEIAAKITTEAQAEAFAAIVGDYLTTGTASSDAGETYTITVTGAGYYLIANTKVPAENGAYTSYILEVVDDVEVSAKSDIPSLDKTVGDVNDSDNTTTQGDADSADYDIGDAVPFTLTATLPTNYGDYETYKLIFHDTMSDGLTFNSDSVKVTIDGIEVASSNYTVSSTTNEDGTTSVTITFADLTDTAATAGSKVVVTYTATLNSNASYMEGNDAYLEYSNNPNEEDGGTTGETPEDKTTVFTFTLTANKVDSDGNKLSGAGFTLYKYDADEQVYIAVGNEVKGDELTSFTWSGLDDGQYKLVETTTPDGYNTMEDVVFYIVAEHTENSLTSLKVVDASGNEIDGYTEVLTNGTITTDITNYSGSELPSTGGIGTTIFYVVGTILVLGAAVLLITRRRMSKAE